MSCIIDNIYINNFKSIKSAKIEGCKSFNLFVGRPNVGKSNILEAMSLFGIPYLASTKVNWAKLLRMEVSSSIFHNGNVSQPVSVKAGSLGLDISYTASDSIDVAIKEGDSQTDYKIINHKNKKKVSEYPLFKSYFYPNDQKFNGQSDLKFLHPLTGENLSQVIKNDSRLRDDINKLLDQYNLQLIFDAVRQEYSVIQEFASQSSDSRLILPINAMADSFRRLIYYMAAIRSNNNSVLILEEPESHTYPPYIIRIVNEMFSADSNQYFITTHNPYVVNEFLENRSKDAALYVVDYKDNHSIVYRLSDEETDMVYENGVDMFFNTDLFSR